MRYIDVSNVMPEQEWLDKSNTALVKLMNLSTHEERVTFIKNNSAIWSELKPWLKELSHGKCWYSEALNHGEDGHVDHFRPKGRTKNADGSILNDEGYWWLAFEWKNYRFCCTYCNCRRVDGSETLGKGDFFH